MLLDFARAFARTARNCSHQKPNDTKGESKIIRLSYAPKKKNRRFNLELDSTVFDVEPFGHELKVEWLRRNELIEVRKPER